MVFETLTVRKEGAVLFAAIAAPPMALVRSRLTHSARRGRGRRPGAGVHERRP